MGIVSNYIWEGAADGGINPVSLVLQQVKVRGREIGLFCVCSSQEVEIGGYMTERLAEWFHKTCLPACEGRKVPLPQALLEPELCCIGRELEARRQAESQKGAEARRQAESQKGEKVLRQGEPWRGRPEYGGLLLTGNRFFLFGQGEVSVQLVNYRYNHPQIKPLAVPLSGRIQKGAGLLLHTPGLAEKIKPEEMCQILHGEGSWQEQRIGKRLRELYQEGRSRGNTGAVGGIYLQMV